MTWLESHQFVFGVLFTLGIEGLVLVLALLFSLLTMKPHSSGRRRTA